MRYKQSVFIFKFKNFYYLFWISKLIQARPALNLALGDISLLSALGASLTKSLKIVISLLGQESIWLRLWLLICVIWSDVLTEAQKRS